MSNTEKTQEAFIADLVQDVNVKTREYNEAKQRENEARSATTRAINEMNSAQKALDRALEKLRSDASIDSDWGRARIEKAKTR
jgi:hypothetical protein